MEYNNNNCPNNNNNCPNHSKQKISTGEFICNIIVIIVFIILLIFSIYLYIGYYLCDNYTCKSFTQSESKTDSKEAQIEYLVENIGGHSVWPMAYIGAAIITFFSFWFLRLGWNIKRIALLFLVSFIVIYFIFAFWVHHYIKPMTTYINNYIESITPAKND